MTDENKTGTTEPKTSESGINEENYSSILADALKKKDEEIEALKKSSAENTRKLTDLIVNGQKAEDEESQKVVHTDEEIAALRVKALSTDGYNLDTAEAIVELYEANLERGINPIVPKGIKIAPEYNDYYRSEQTIECLKQCIDVAKGDRDIFQRELMRLMKK